MRGDPEALCTHYLRTLFVGMRGEGGNRPGGGGGAPRRTWRGRGAWSSARRRPALPRRHRLRAGATLSLLCIYYR
jgi:hypothetical protein